MNKLAAFALSALLIAAPATVFGAQRIGTATTVKNTVTGTVGGRMSVGSGVHSNERITSEPNGEAQLMFLDETIFNVGNGASVTLDQFVYNPNRKTGNVVLNVTKGAFRFISGSAKPTTYTIKTPVATIGVRGTVFSGNISSDLFMSLKLMEGQLLICLKAGANIAGLPDGAAPTGGGGAGQQCYLVNPGLFHIGFGPLEEFENPPGDLTDPLDGEEDPLEIDIPFDPSDDE